MKNLQQDIIFKLETEENKGKKSRNKDKMMNNAAETMRRIVLEKLNKRRGEC